MRCESIFPPRHSLSQPIRAPQRQPQLRRVSNSTFPDRKSATSQSMLHTGSQNASPPRSTPRFLTRNLPPEAYQSTLPRQLMCNKFPLFPPSEPSTISPHQISVDSNSLSSIQAPQRLIPVQITNFPQGNIASTISSVSRQLSMSQQQCLARQTHQSHQLPMSNNLSRTLSQHQYPAAASCQCRNINVPPITNSAIITSN